jgi:plastocyanin
MMGGRIVTAAACMAVFLSGCGGNDSPTAPSQAGGTGGPIAATITITASGAAPSNVTVAVGSRVTFVNNDTRSHDMSSDPHPIHTDCPEINVGSVAPGQSRSTQNLVTPRTCGFHDHDDPDNAALQGTIRIQ